MGNLRVAGLVLIAFVLAPSGVWALHGSEDVPSGRLIVPAGGSAAIPLDGADSGDRIQWTWTVAGGDPAQLSTWLHWVDGSGQEHSLAPDPSGQTFGSFVAPADFARGRLAWRNAGAEPVAVEWNYVASAPFWRRPDMFLPALIPVIFLVAAYSMSRVIDRRRRQSSTRFHRVVESGP